MNDLWGKIGSGIGVAAFIAIAASFFTIRDDIKRIQDQEPLKEQLRDVELEQIRQGTQLNSNEIDVMNMEMRNLEDRIDALERLR